MAPLGITCKSQCNIQKEYDCSYEVLSNSIAFVKKNGYYQGLWRKGDSDDDFKKQGDKPSNSFSDDSEWHFHCMTIRAEDGEIKYFRDGQHVSSTSAQFGYGSVSEGNYEVFVGRMAKETDDKGASEVSYRPFNTN